MVSGGDSAAWFRPLRRTKARSKLLGLKEAEKMNFFKLKNYVWASDKFIQIYNAKSVAEDSENGIDKSIRLHAGFPTSSSGTGGIIAETVHYELPYSYLDLLKFRVVRHTRLSIVLRTPKYGNLEVQRHFHRDRPERLQSNCDSQFVNLNNLIEGAHHCSWRKFECHIHFSIF